MVTWILPIAKNLYYIAPALDFARSYNNSRNLAIITNHSNMCPNTQTSKKPSMTHSNILQTQLADLLSTADKATLITLVNDLLEDAPEKCQHSVTYLRSQVVATDSDGDNNNDNPSFTYNPLELWDGIESSLKFLMEDSGSDDELEEMCDKLYVFASKIDQYGVDEALRIPFLDIVIPLIEQDQYGMDYALCDVADAICVGDKESIYLANQYVKTQQKGLIKKAIALYRKSGDTENYLQLRQQHLNSADDYHDLATFYWDAGQHHNAIATAKEGMTQDDRGHGNLRVFLADAALSNGDRETYLEYYFEEHTSYLTLSSYQAFEALCTPDEWAVYDPKITAMLNDDNSESVAQIHFHRKDYDKAVRYFTAASASKGFISCYSEFTLAGALEQYYPEQILSFYRAVLGNLDESHSRKTYAHQATLFAKVRHLLVDTIKRPDEWRAYAKLIKRQNSRRPAFQQEFASEITDWHQL